MTLWTVKVSMSRETFERLAQRAKCPAGAGTQERKDRVGILLGKEVELRDEVWTWMAGNLTDSAVHKLRMGLVPEGVRRFFNKEGAA